jgi:RNA ligase
MSGKEIVVENITLQIQACLGVHPAIRLPFDELYSGIIQEVEKGNVNRQVKDDLELFDYTRSCVFEKHWNVFTLISRGLILCPSQKKVVCLPLIKFFNFAEIIYLPENEDFRATLKYDGSMICTFFHSGKWYCSTRGSFVSNQAIWAEKWMHQNVNMGFLVPGRTYIFEVIYKENRIVISYDFEGLVLITGYNEFGYEFLYEDTVEYARQLGTRVVEAPGFCTIEELLKKAEILPSSEEGWVVRFDNGYRIKIKSSEYLKVHRLVSNCTPLAVWDMLRSCMDIEPIIQQLPEEFARDIKSIRKILEEKEKNLIGDIECLVNYTKLLSDKELGLKIPEIAKQFPISAYFIFAARKQNFLEEVKKVGKARNALFSRFRPTANILEGWVPSTSMNRFQEDL